MKPRKLSNEEMFNLPDDWKRPEHPERGGWENPQVSTKDYYPSIIEIWEVSQIDYHRWKDAGELCLKYYNKFYIA